VIGFDFGRAFQLWADRAGCDPGVLEQRFVLDEAYEQHERGEIQASDYLVALRKSLGIAISDKAFIDGWNDVHLGAPFLVSLACCPSLNNTSRSMRLQNSNPTHQSVSKVGYANELAPFQSILVSSELGLRKPDSEAFRVVARWIGIEPQEILFFDDTPGNVDGARAAGCRA